MANGLKVELLPKRLTVRRKGQTLSILMIKHSHVMTMKHISISDEAKAKMTAIKGGVIEETKTEVVTYSDIIVTAVDAVGQPKMVRMLVEGDEKEGSV